MTETHPTLFAYALLAVSFIPLLLLVWMKRKRKPKIRPYNPERDELYVATWFAEGNTTCADCGGILLEGPSGGLCVNTRCKDCGAEFNICMAGLMSERLTPPK